MELHEDDIDTALKRLSGAPVHPGLAGSSAVVIERMAARRNSGPSSRFGSLAVVAAVGMGLLAAGMPSGRVEATPILSPFGPSPPLAPSTLLTGR